MKQQATIALLLAGAGLAVATPVRAQEAGAPGAADEKASSPEVGEIIVTAQKRAQSAQDVPVSISAISGENLVNAGITDVASLQAAVPNITIGTSFGYANLFIRGLGLNSVFANVDPSVTLYEDGTVISQPAAQLFSFYDLARVEVLRGPQGTLYGRNSTGGTINLITNQPTDRMEGFLRAEVGNYAAFETEGAISGPIADGVSGRLAFFTSNHDGYGKNLVTARGVNDLNTRSVRAQLKFAPSANFDLLLVGEYGRENDAANALFFQRETFPGVLADSNPANDSLAAPGRGGFPTGNPRDYASDVDPLNLRETYAFTATARLKVSDVLSFTNIANYRKFDMDMVQDLDLSSVRSSSVQDFLFDDRHYSEEFQANVKTGPIDLVTGFYYFNERLFHQNSVGVAAKVGEFNQSAPGNGRRVYLTGVGKTETWALYWNANLSVTDQITLHGGGRYTHDKRSVDNNGYIWAGPNQLYFPGPDDQRTFTNYSSEAGVQFKPARRLMLYYTFAQGFKAGTGQLGTTQAALPTIVNPEKISSHEIGFKSTFGQGRYVFNIAAYTYKLDNVQLDRTLPGGPAGFTTIFENATSQKGRGIEADLTFEPVNRFHGSASIAIQDTEFGSFISTNPTNPKLFNAADPTLPQNIAGNPARNAPPLAGQLTLAYDAPLNGGTLTISGTGSYKGRQYFTEFKDPLLSQAPYALLDGSLRYSFPDDRWQASLFVKNLTDRLVEGAAYALGTGRVIGRTFLAPRTFGASVNYRF